MHIFNTLQVVIGLASLVSAIPAPLPVRLSTLGTAKRQSLEPRDTTSKRDTSLLSTRGLASLSQKATNGNSNLGSIAAPKYGKFTELKQTNATTSPWGNKTADNSNPYSDAPNTGVTRYYDWDVERLWLAPDGVRRQMLVVDGSFPGPTIEANWGDMISVTVHNKITAPEEGTALHWHGFLQKNSPWEDGVPGITQCPIPPGETFTYVFRAELYGTSWWHAHFSAQYSSGLFGAMIIHGPEQPEAKHDADLGPVLISDYYHAQYEAIIQNVMSADPTKIVAKSDNNLINGKGNFDCSLLSNTTAGACTPNAGFSKFQFISGKTFKLRLINAGAEGLQKFSIDNHDLTVVSYDFVPIKPYTTKVVTLGVGQRADILVTANQAPGQGYWMRSTMSKCSATNQPNALAIVYYENANLDSAPTTTAVVDTTDPCANDDLSLAVPYYEITPPAVPDVTQTVNIGLSKNATGHTLWTVNDSSFRTNYNEPILQALQQGQTSASLPRERNVYDFGNAKSIRLVINNLSPIYHPMHIHGHNMYVLSSTANTNAGNTAPIPGPNPQTNPTPDASPKANPTPDTKIVDPKSNPTPDHRQTPNPTPDQQPHGGSKTINPSTHQPRDIVNPQNPHRRDVHILPPNGQIIIQIDGDNPGVWPLHCHIAWHVSGGLYMNIVEQPDALKAATIPDNHQQLCKKWDDYTSKIVVNQIDSGLKFREKQRVRSRMMIDERHQ